MITLVPPTVIIIVAVPSPEADERSVRLCGLLLAVYPVPPSAPSIDSKDAIAPGGAVIVATVRFIVCSLDVPGSFNVRISPIA